MIGGIHLMIATMSPSPPSWPRSFAFGALALIASAATLLAQGKKPNIRVIWGDDIGYWNISAYNQGMMGYKTPNIDRIAKEGKPVGLYVHHDDAEREFACDRESHAGVAIPWTCSSSPARAGCNSSCRSATAGSP